MWVTSTNCASHSSLLPKLSWARIPYLHDALSTAASAHQAAKWLAASGLLSQFSLARQITQEASHIWTTE